MGRNKKSQLNRLLVGVSVMIDTKMFAEAEELRLKEQRSMAYMLREGLKMYLESRKQASA